MFPSTQNSKDVNSSATERPGTPTMNNFITPVSTPQGSPSKKTIPPGAHDLPSAFEGALKLNTSALDSPIKLGRPQTQNQPSPLSPTKGNLQPTEELGSANGSPSIDQSIIHKTASPGSPLKKQQGQENTPPSRIPVAEPLSYQQHNHAAASRQEVYHPKEGRPNTTATRKFNTQRGLTPEELEILKKPNVRRLVNVTQLCKS